MPAGFPNPAMVKLEVVKEAQALSFWPQLASFWAGKVEKPDGDNLVALTRLVEELDREPGAVDVALDRVWPKDFKDTPLTFLAIQCLAAVDGLPGLVKALEEENRPEARQAAGAALRSWLGSATGHSVLLTQHLRQSAGFSEAQAGALLHLFGGFVDDDLKPEQSVLKLAGLLSDSRLAIRQLASWHLEPLAETLKKSFPESSAKIAYDPAGKAAEREQAAQTWRQLLEQLFSAAKKPPAAGKP